MYEVFDAYDETHGRFNTIAEAHGCASFDRLGKTGYSIWKVDLDGEPVRCVCDAPPPDPHEPTPADTPSLGAAWWEAR